MPYIDVKHGESSYTQFRRIGVFKLLPLYQESEQATLALILSDFESIANFPKGSKKLPLERKSLLDAKYDSAADNANHFSLIFDDPAYGNVLGVNYILGNLKYTGDANRIIKERLGAYVSNWRITADNVTNRYVHFCILRELITSNLPVNIYARRAPRVSHGARTHLITKDLEYQIQAFNELEWNKENVAVSDADMRFIDYDF